MRLTQDLNHYYRSKLYERIQSLPMRAFDDERIGDAVYRVMVDTPSITTALYRLLLTPIAAPAGIFASAAVLHWTFGDHPELVWTALAFLPLSLLVSLPFAALARRRGASSRAAGATTTSTIEESVTHVLAVQSLGGASGEHERFARDSWTGFARYRGVVWVSMAAFVAALVPGVALAGRAFLYGVDLVVSSEISVGDFGLLFTYFVQIAFFSVELGALWIRVQGAIAGLGRVFFLMDLPAESDTPGATPLPRRPPAGISPEQAGVLFENVEFCWPDGTCALSGVTLHAPRGAVTALVGPAGAGKTTLASLVPRFHDPTSGRVRLDGVDLSTATLASVRARIAFVFQETALFDDTVRENLRLGKPDATDDELKRAARVAGTDEFIATLPQGYDTPLGRSGGKLSVGQKQRLAIARALVCEPDVLILDEPTSALDPATESRLVAALREASRERVVLVIAHRLSTVHTADRIVFLDEGRVREAGSHDELMRIEGGAYRRFVELQTS
jgi:ABC-type multidrug transport system fused ATPase/permease subunit